ncbi:hypothetical protein KKJ01_14160 [Xenorhabdus bovienii]|uniref:Uncharacterized protein n=1 Tax=Xenorhabdus bovienii TaxID=40576 RepID=A0AAJ1JCT8_XENBV|nr:hypothetical protein [Xenorhabdus bovienii]MDE1479343.1 hypothetical protein [Xenorhabdus bovienii]MDE9511022.1 hypothetical protein [Xenorhabdus bovienii]MDE9522679.1 hypothetical protein [Xenorhabdus bovienii]
MSDVIDPKKNPEQAAQQVLIELIRAEKTGGIHGVGIKTNTEALLYAYTAIYNHFKKLNIS